MIIGFVTSSDLGDITPDDSLIATALADLGIPVHPIIWDAGDPREDLRAVVLRSPWNYHLNPEAFLGWVNRASESALVCNSPEVVRWNSHKGYLFELQRAGVPVAETVLCKKHDACDLLAIMRERNWEQVVVKPAISASSFMTCIVGAQGRAVEDGTHLLESILQTRDALVQPFMPEIFERGERCLIFIDGKFSHAVQKAPFTHLPGGGRPVIAEPDELRIAQHALSVLEETPLYARVDLLRAADGGDRVMELELIDPELYFRFDSESPHRFASALIRRFA